MAIDYNDKQKRFLELMKRIGQVQSDGAYKQVMTAYEEVLELYPTDPFILEHRGEYHMEISDHQSAVADFTCAIENGSGSAETLIKRGDCYRELGLLTESSNDFSGVLDSANPEWKAWRKRAEVYLMQGREQDARIDLEAYVMQLRSLLRIDPSIWWFWYEAGDVYYMLDHALGSRECFERFLSIAPEKTNRYQICRASAEEKLRKLEELNQSIRPGILGGQ